MLQLKLTCFHEKPLETLYTCHVGASETVNKQDFLLHCSSKKAGLENKMKGRAIGGVGLSSWAGEMADERTAP